MIADSSFLESSNDAEPPGFASFFRAVFPNAAFSPF